jgi:hypothetical protein
MLKQIVQGVNTPELPLEWEALPYQAIQLDLRSVEIFRFHMALRRASLQRLVPIREWSTTTVP